MLFFLCRILCTVVFICLEMCTKRTQIGGVVADWPAELYTHSTTVPASLHARRCTKILHMYRSPHTSARVHAHAITTILYRLHTRPESRGFYSPKANDETPQFPFSSPFSLSLSLPFLLLPFPFHSPFPNPYFPPQIQLRGLGSLQRSPSAANAFDTSTGLKTNVVAASFSSPNISYDAKCVISPRFRRPCLNVYTLR